jgi:Beta-propeller repeat
MGPNKRQGLWGFLLYLSILAVVFVSSRQLSKHFPIGPALSTRPGTSQFRNRSQLNPKFLPRPSRKELIFDPVLVYSTLLGGTSNNTGANPQSQEVAAIFVDSSGNLYVTGSTNGSDFPVTPGVVGPANPNSNYVGFLSKLDPTGHLIFSTYLFGMTIGSAVAVDPSNGNIIVAGQSIAYDKPTPLPIPTGTTPFNASASDISIVRLNSTATAILNATYLGGSGANAAFDQLSGMAVDSTGNVYVAGATTSSDFPTLNPLQGALGNTQEDMFVTKMNPNLSALVYSTYLGQNTFVEAPITTVGTASHGIAVDTSGDAYVVGVATSGFPTTSGAVQATCTAECALMAKLNPAGSALVYATYLGGNFSLNGFQFNVNAVAVDASQNVFLAGGLWAPGFAT